ncbi:hypothetical protein [Ensifer canadensis]
MVKRHQRQTQSTGSRHHQQGSLVAHLSNIAIADPKDGKPTRVGFSDRRMARRSAWPSVRE